MKVEIERAGGDGFILRISEPTTTQDETDLRDFGEALARAHIINCRGFGYMKEEVEFLIQPYRGTD